MTKTNSVLDSRNSLIIKIALFLNFLSKDGHTKLIRDIKKYNKEGKIDVLKFMMARKYIAQSDLAPLKKACMSFAKSQEDTRFGALAVEFNFITQSNLNLALEEQHKLSGNGNSIRIGDLLVNAGMISQRQRNLILQKQKIENQTKKPAANGENLGEHHQPDEETAFDPSHMREIREPEVVFYIQNDGLKAFVKKSQDFDQSLLPADLKILLEKVGIIYGVVSDDDLTNFINLPKYKDTVFEVAKGLEPIHGTDAQIVFMFETDYLKAGALDKDGTIDFKDRGDIPFVGEGDVLAEKIPPKPGKEGVNIYGDAIPQIEAADVSFILGKGVHLSRDELKVMATNEGSPKLKPNGEISVNSAYFIEGDVDYTTGHVKFDKNVYITGSIKNGFRVEAIDVVAKTIDGGIVKAEGDVFIQSGVTESNIQAKGNVKAGFIHRSKVMAMGDLNVFKEVVDTEALIEGTFDMSKGKMFSSSLCAKGGARVYSIGSEKAKSSDIKVGASMYIEKELSNIDAEIERRQNVLEESTNEKSKIDSELSLIAEKLENFDQSRKRTLTMIEELKQPSDDQKADIFQKSLDEAEKKIHDLIDRKALLEARLKKITKEIEHHAEAVKTSVKEKFDLKRLDQATPPKPILEVSGKAFSGTKISGRRSHMILNQNISRSRVMEMDSSAGDNNRANWEMIITNL